MRTLVMSLAVGLVGTLLPMPAFAMGTVVAAPAPVELKVGNLAPDLILLVATRAGLSAAPVTPSALLDRTVVLAFCPQAWTRGCTIQMKHDRDQYDSVFGGWKAATLDTVTLRYRVTESSDLIQQSALRTDTLRSTVSSFLAVTVRDSAGRQWLRASYDSMLIDMDVDERVTPILEARGMSPHGKRDSLPPPRTWVLHDGRFEGELVGGAIDSSRRPGPGIGYLLLVGMRLAAAGPDSIWHDSGRRQTANEVSKRLVTWDTRASLLERSRSAIGTRCAGEISDSLSMDLTESLDRSSFTCTAVYDGRGLLREATFFLSGDRSTTVRSVLTGVGVLSRSITRLTSRVTRL